jgi:hypothetical protein
VAGNVDIPQSEVEEATAALDGVRSEWLDRHGVTGVDVGLRRDRKGLAIRVYVRPQPEEGGPELGRDYPERLGRFPVELVVASFEPQR